MEEKHTKRRARIAGLDALRTLAIAGVTFFHMFPEQVVGGYLGVSLFFALTGFLLAYNSRVQYMNGKFSVAHYYISRVKRIYPSLLFMLFLSIGTIYLILPRAVSAIRPEFLSIIFGYNNWWQIAQNADYFTRLMNQSPFTHLWFLGIELQYYLIWPVLFLGTIAIAKRFSMKHAAAFLAVLGTGFATLMPIMYHPNMDVTRLYYGTDTRVYALLWGAALGLLAQGSTVLERVERIEKPLHVVVYAAIVLVTLAGYALLDGQNPLLYRGGMIAFTLLFCVQLYLTQQMSYRAGKLLDNPVCQWIGKLSYGIFLWQYPVIFLFEYFSWTQLPMYGVLELGAILLLSLWTYFVCDGFFKIKHKALTIFIIISFVASLGLMFFGAKAIVVSSDEKYNDKGKLQNMLAENAKVLQEQEQARRAATEKKRAGQVKFDGVCMIGDSVMLGSTMSLLREMPGSYIDASVSRYVGDGLEIAKAFNDQGKLGKIVVIALGTNGPIAGWGDRYEVQTKALIEYLGPDRQIFWVNVYAPHLKWHTVNNDYINKMAAEHKNIHVVDWCGLISQHKDWLVDDGVHPDVEGSKAYAKLVHDTIVKTLAQEGMPLSAK